MDCMRARVELLQHSGTLAQPHVAMRTVTSRPSAAAESRSSRTAELPCNLGFTSRCSQAIHATECWHSSLPSPLLFSQWLDLLHSGAQLRFATIGYIVPEFFKFPGYLAPSSNLKFADVPNGLGAITKASFDRVLHDIIGTRGHVFLAL